MLVNHDISFKASQIADNFDEPTLTVLDYGENGELVEDCYEIYEDSNGNGVYDFGEGYIDDNNDAC